MSWPSVSRPPLYCDWRPDDCPDDQLFISLPWSAGSSFGFDQRRFYFGRLNLAQELADRLTGRAEMARARASSRWSDRPAAGGTSSLVLAAVAPRVQAAAPPISRRARDRWPGWMRHWPPFPPSRSLQEEPSRRCSWSINSRAASPRAPPRPPIAFAASADRGQTDSQRCLVALTMRCKLWGEVASFSDLKASMLRRMRRLIRSWTRTILAQAMRLQVTAELRLEDGLDTTILNAVHAQPGAMPLLQQALAQLWS